MGSSLSELILLGTLSGRGAIFLQPVSHKTYKRERFKEIRFLDPY